MTWSSGTRLEALGATAATAQREQPRVLLALHVLTRACSAGRAALGQLLRTRRGRQWPGLPHILTLPDPPPLGQRDQHGACFLPYSSKPACSLVGSHLH